MQAKLVPFKQVLEQRSRKLDQLARSVGNTTLFELWPGFFPNEVRVFAKAEYTNPTGSHYDRIYNHLFGVHLTELLTDRSDLLVEVSSGNAAASFVWFCRQLEFPCAVILPRGLPGGVLDLIGQLNPEAEVYYAENYDEYVSGAVAKLHTYMQNAERRKLRVHVLNHSRDAETLNGTRGIAEETVKQLKSAFGISDLHFYIAACGNGSTIVGPGRVFSESYRNLRVVGFEPEEAPVVRSYLEHGVYQPALGGLRHCLFGTGVWGVRFPFLHDPNYGLRDLLRSSDDVILIDGKRKQDIRTLAARTGGQYGFTSLAAMALAHEFAQNPTNNGANILILLYDRGAKYDGFEIF